jgi:preprotein translocase subunit YajC
MLISAAYAAGAALTSVPPTGDTGGMFQMIMLNGIGVVFVVTLFYFMMIVPQQKRFRRHNNMLNALKKGDAVVTAGGLIGKVDKIKDGDDEVVIDLGNGIKVTAVRSTIQQRQADVKDTK